MDKFNELLHFVGDRIRSLRKAKGLSQENFAFQCNLDRTYISDVERGKRNISIINLYNVANALDTQLSRLFAGFPSDESSRADQDELCYKIRTDFSISCGFDVTPDNIAHAAKMTSDQLYRLPFALFQSIDLKALSGMVGALFSTYLAERVGAIVNPIEKGHPDIIPISGRDAIEAQLRNYPQGLEVKCTVGKVEKGRDLQPGEQRLPKLTGLTWQAHHREVEQLLGLVIDFAGRILDERHLPVVTAAFYANDLEVEDWGKISGTTRRNTKVTGMRVSGKRKMGAGWIIIIDEVEYQKKYSRILSFSIEKEG